jgi:hypothetical protein
MNQANDRDGELRALDLSSLSFGEFTVFFFAREVVPDDEQFDYFLTDLHGEKYDQCIPSSPQVLINHLTKLFSEFDKVARKYTLAQMNQGIWGIWGENLRLYEFLFDSSVPLETRVGCIRSMFHVFSDYVSKLEPEPDPNTESGFYMWWDLILHGFWVSQHLASGTWSDATILDSESRVLLDVMFETLTRILALPSRESQRSALHGLGHLHHPSVHDAVQRFIDTSTSDFRPKWLEQCRDCSVL